MGTLSLVAACSSSASEEGDVTPPAIISAAFVGTGPTPLAGESLILFLSEDVSLAAGATLDDGDVVLSSGSLGTVGSPPTQLDSRSVMIVLGAGVSFTPGTTTIVFRPENDAVQDISGLFGDGGSPVAITAGDGDSPTITALTLNGIDADLNGSGPAGGTLQTPRTGFAIEFTASDPTSSIDPPEITVNKNVTVAGMPRSPGTDLAGDLVLSQSGADFSYLVPSGVLFNTTLFTLTVQVRDSTGMVSTPTSMAFHVRSLTNQVRPFETNVNASQVWFLDLSRDVESYTVNLANPTTPVQVTSGANGRPDLDDLFLALGLHSTAPIANVTPGVDSNETVHDLLKTAITTRLGTLFSSANITFTFDSPGTFPGQDSVPYNNVGFSQICIAGAEDPAGDTGILGLAIFDPHNDTQNNDCLVTFQGSQRLGVFIHTLVNDGIKSSLGTLFRFTYDQFTPARGGTAVGDDKPNDASRLLNPMFDARAGNIDTAITRMAQIIAVVTAHEIGHSVGLVADGPMPNGLYGNDNVNFPLPVGIDPSAASGHIHIGTPQFPFGSTNVMSPGIAFTAAQHSSTGFNSLNLAYLLETVIHN